LARVVLFSTTTCSWCRRAKKYLKEKRVPFKEINVEFFHYYTEILR
jgi:glutaredoxin 3